MPIKIMTEETIRGLSRLEREQLPYVLAQTVTQVTKRAQIAVRTRTSLEFNPKTDFIPRGIWIETAKKSVVVATGQARGVIFTAPKIAFMDIHEPGGTRSPASKSGASDRGRALSLPGKALTKYATKTGTGAVRNRWKPVSLLEQFNKTKGSAAGVPRRQGKRGTKTAFVTKSTTSGLRMIVRRRGKKPFPLEILYVFRPKAEYKGTWKFENTVRVVVDREFNTIFARNMAAAVSA